jgi:hypothetical protein
MPNSVVDPVTRLPRRGHRKSFSIHAEAVHQSRAVTFKSCQELFSVGTACIHVKWL